MNCIAKEQLKPIHFYQIPFSHFCDKVRWALDFYSLPYESINYSPRRSPGLKNAPSNLQKLVPIIEDPSNESTFISDSTPILLYLDKHYGDKKTLFHTNMTVKNDVIIQYCLKLDSELGLCARRLAYLHVISEKPAILSVLIDGNYNKTTRDDWSSYFFGLIGSCIVIARFGIHQIREEHIFDKTICILEEIQQNIDGKQYLFNDQFTAADLTLTALIQPLRMIPALFIKYKSIFEYCDRIRERHDPKEFEDSYVERLLKHHRQRRQSSQYQSIFRNTIWYIFYIVFYPFKFVFITTGTQTTHLYQYPSTNLTEKAHNDNRILKFQSLVNKAIFFSTYLWHFCFTIPKQMEFVNKEGNRILHRHS
ncbi:unnamed protein product [Adineta steineri]|uniref:GST N-terminal domain-containing protein n=1 Tax=Adineta steineri TaxID=433720 RepID=A0A820B4D4_9BILA|nr:unnamed protein product [Adineta steineri]CAF4186563.1 unnamed protein product [Adineta steineri]